MRQEAIHDLNNPFKIEFSSEFCIGERTFEAHFHKNSEMIAVERGKCFITENGKVQGVSYSPAITLQSFPRLFTVLKHKNLRRSGGFLIMPFPRIS